MQRLPDKNTRRGRERGEGGVIPQQQQYIQRVDLGYIPHYQHLEYFFQRMRGPTKSSAWMEWAKKSYREGLMRGRGELPKARSILIMDKLHAQTTDGFKEYLAKHCNTLAWYGPSECTDEVQPVDAGAGRFLKVEVGRQMDIHMARAVGQPREVGNRVADSF